jgi:16S rRNA (guanine1516-N2)-methyltransferase
MMSESTMSLEISVSVISKERTYQLKAEKLAELLSINYVPDITSCQTNLTLCYTEQGLKLFENTVKNRFLSVLYVDFVHGKNGYRLAQNSTIKQPLARAVGIKPGNRPVILDATAGLGGDSFVLAALGCQMTLCERNPVIRALLQDGIERALLSPLTSAIFSKNIQLLPVDSISFLKGDKKLKDHFSTIYLDPMYPHSTSTALGKKNMRVTRLLVGDDPDYEELMAAAELYSPRRITVKRPKKAPTISDRIPDHVTRIKSSRFDVYFQKAGLP